jgi:hypothetical protein
MRTLLTSLVLVLGITLGAVAPASAAPRDGVTHGPRIAHAIDSVQILDGQRLLVGAGCPYGEAAVKVVESSRVVRLRAIYSATRFACLVNVTVRLKAPLGGRQIVDATTGQPI